MNICVIGGGWYGCYVTEFLIDNFKNINVTLLEKEKTLFSGSSYKNQNRLHLGFHYPRCEITRNKCKINFEKFKKKYNFILEEIEKNYYVISNESKVSYNDFIKLYKDYSLVENNFIKNVEGKIINTNEMYINFEKARKYFLEKFKDKIKLVFNYEVKNIEKLKYNKIFNCTYNQIQCETNVIYEKCLTLLYKKVNTIPFDCLTVMDGEFSSLFLYKNDIYTLTNVKYSPLVKSKHFNDVKNFNEYNLDKKKKYMEENIKFYYPDFNKNFVYTGFYESYKCKNKCLNDSRDININIKNNIFNIWCGKISLIFELDEKINKFVIF